MDVVGGFPLVRRLGAGARAEVWLGHSARERERTVAIKLYREHVTTAEITAELDALARADSPHLVRLLDVTTVDGRPAPILQRLDPRGLPARIATGRPLSRGEVVTILAPVAEALDGLHSAGVSHGSVGIGSILLDDRGAPVLACFGAARPFADAPSPARLDAEPSVLRDRDDLRRVAVGVAESIGGPAAAELAQWVRVEEPDPARLADQLYGFAPGAPVEFDPLAAAHEPTAPRLPRPSEEEAVAASATPSASETARVWALPAWIERAIEQSPLAGVRERLVPALARVRRPVWAAGGAGLAALVLAVSLLGTGSAPGTASATGAPSPTGPDQQQRPVSTASAAPTDLPTEVAAEDPLVAAAALLDRRQLCFDDLSAECIDEVDQLDSAGWEADRAMIADLRAAQTSEPNARLAGAELTLVQRLGDSAIVAATKAGMTVLLVRTEGRWWIRDLMAG
jgi:hypothetical protein